MGKWFPKLYDTLMMPLERRGFGTIRKELIQKSHGKVLEVGYGTGFNFPFYQPGTQVTGIDPEPQMARLAIDRARQSNISIEMMQASAEQIPFPDDTFDCVVCTLVLCTVPNPSKALSEIRRVCKPDGLLLIFEHVKIKHRFWGLVQEWLTPLWKHLCDGCHLNRHTLELVKQAGFKVTSIKRYYYDIFLVIEAVNKKGRSVTPHYGIEGEHHRSAAK